MTNGIVVAGGLGVTALAGFFAWALGRAAARDDLHVDQALDWGSTSLDGRAGPPEAQSRVDEFDARQSTT